LVYIVPRDYLPSNDYKERMSTHSFSPSRGRLSGRPDVRIKGRGGFTVVDVADDKGDWSDVVDYLARHISQADGFFRDERLSLAIGDRLVTAGDLQAVHEVLEDQNIVLVSLHTGNSDAFQVASQLGLDVVWESDKPQPVVRTGKREASNGSSFLARTARDLNTSPNLEEDSLRPGSDFRPAPHSALTEEPLVSESADEHAALTPWADEPGAESMSPPYVYRGTLRSGQSVRHAGTVVVLGDVNPGAQVVSGGDVLVWGRLRGTVHAGAMGNPRAIVAALDFEPVQMRIAQHIAMTPKSASNNPGYWFWKRDSSGNPEVARVIDNQIFVDPWDADR
jgi:septum site-determining protein MinC